MSQKFHVLRCYKCRTFQSHIVKKSNKWDCKVCGDRQSLQRTFGSGTGKECRLHVQTLNMQRSHAEQADPEDTPPAHTHVEPFTPAVIHQVDGSASKWTKYMTKPSVVNDKSAFDDSELVAIPVSEVPTKKRKRNIKKNRNVVNTEDNDDSLKYQNQPFIEDFNVENFPCRHETTHRFNVNDDFCDIPQISDKKHGSITDRTNPVTSKWTKYTMPPIMNCESQSYDSESVTNTISKVVPKKRKLDIENDARPINAGRNGSSFQFQNRAFQGYINNGKNISLENRCDTLCKLNINDNFCDIPQVSDGKRRSTTHMADPGTSKWTKYLVETVSPDQKAVPPPPKLALGDSKHSPQIFDSFMNDELFTLDDV